MKRRGMALGLAALMTCTALFTGCGGTGETASKDSESTETTAKADNKDSDEKETIKFTYWGSGDEKRLLKNL